MIGNMYCKDTMGYPSFLGHDVLVGILGSEQPILLTATLL